MTAVFWKDGPMSDGFWIALVGVLGAVLGAALSSWLAGRAKAADAVRELRLKAYPAVWEQTSVISRWPRTDATWSHLCDLHVTLRTWYFETGGLYLSENARRRYGSLQQLLAQLLDLNKDTEVVDPTDYSALMDEASAFRSALTEDLQSREQRSVISVVRRALLHRKQESAATKRREAATPTPPPAPAPSPTVTPAPTDASATAPSPSAAPAAPGGGPVGSSTATPNSAGSTKTAATTSSPLAASPTAPKQTTNQRAGAQAKSRS